MAQNWSISKLKEDEVEEFVKCQFPAFVQANNTLHPIVHPNPAAAVASHKKVIDDAKQLPADTDIIYLKAVDNASGQIIGGIKCCYYGSETVKTTSPYASGICSPPKSASEEERYRALILNIFLERRIRDLQYPHALIDILFVHPDHHRRGVGRALVSRTCSIADEKHLPAIVEASPEGKRTYELCGYVSKEAETIAPEGWPGKPEHLYYWMERESRTA